jgi:predicted Zn-dependent protease
MNNKTISFNKRLRLGFKRNYILLPSSFRKKNMYQQISTLEDHFKGFLIKHDFKNKKNYYALTYLGKLYLKTNQPLLAIKAFEAAYSKAPNNTMIITNLSNLYLQLSSPKKIPKNKDPHKSFFQPRILLSIAKKMSQTGNLQLSRQLAYKALEFMAEKYKTKHLLIEIALIEKNIDEAKWWLNEIPDLENWE